MREPYVVAVGASHRLARFDSIPLRELADEGLIMTRGVKALYVKRNFRHAFKRACIQPRTSQEVNELHAILGLVAGGLGVALVPRSIVKLHLDGVEYRPLLANESPMAEMFIARRVDDQTSTVRQFIDMAKQIYPDAVSV
ncbi:hypothetical protein N183_24335 [Sinorhizobium sp. Sb3]|nr:hypothetical protein N183_24335 [Sinorhizobium sp. Sb3]